MCPAAEEGWHCTAVLMHRGDHVAYGTSGIAYARWPRVGPWFALAAAELVRQYETRTGPLDGDPFDADLWMAAAAALLRGGA